VESWGLGTRVSRSSSTSSRVRIRSECQCRVRGECARGAGVGCERRVSAVLEVGTIASRCFEHIDYNTNTNTKYTYKYTYKSDICILALLTNVVTALHCPSGSRHLGGGLSDVPSRPYTTISNGQRSTVNGMFRYLSSCFFFGFVASVSHAMCVRRTHACITALHHRDTWRGVGSARACMT
jgi:hypothetical protein